MRGFIVKEATYNQGKVETAELVLGGKKDQSAFPVALQSLGPPWCLADLSSISHWPFPPCSQPRMGSWSLGPRASPFCMNPCTPHAGQKPGPTAQYSEYPTFFCPSGWPKLSPLWRWYSILKHFVYNWDLYSIWNHIKWLGWPRWWQGRSTSPMRKGWGHWDYSA